MKREFVQLIPEFGMSDMDQGFGSLPNALPMQIGDPELGNDVVHVSARGDNACTRIKVGNNAG